MRDLREDLCSARTKLESLQKESDGIAPKGDLDRSLRRLAGDDLPVGLEAVSQALQSSMLSVATTEATKIGAQRRKDIDSLKAGFQRLFVKQSDTPSAAKRKKVDDKETTRNQKRKTSDDPPPQPRGFARWSNNDVSDFPNCELRNTPQQKKTLAFPHYHVTPITLMGNLTALWSFPPVNLIPTLTRNPIALSPLRFSLPVQLHDCLHTLAVGAHI